MVYFRLLKDEKGKIDWFDSIFKPESDVKLINIAYGV